MNIQQLRYVLAIERQNSFSKAAQQLFISQPSLSNSIKELEKELGITIFLRNKNGIQITPIGVELCKKIRSALEQIDDISSLSSNKQKYTFKLATENCSFALVAFNDFCKKFQDVDKMDFTIEIYETMGVIDRVENLKSDIGLLLLNNTCFDEYLNIISSKNLEYVKLVELPLNIIIRRNHPILKEEFKAENLIDYPFVMYISEQTYTLSYLSNLIALGLINPEKCIRIGAREVKCSLVAETDAFSIVPSLHYNYISRFDIVIIPLENHYVNVGYIKTKNSILNVEALEFINFFKESLATSNL